jgi:hypothetical protein
LQILLVIKPHDVAEIFAVLACRLSVGLWLFVLDFKHFRVASDQSGGVLAQREFTLALVWTTSLLLTAS